VQTNSISFPHIFDVARNRVGIYEDNQSIVNRTRLLILTEPTELYNNPDFGVGLRRHLWQYKRPQEIDIIKDRIKLQIDKYEPCVDAEKTSFASGLLFTGSEDDIDAREFDKVKMTIGLSTIYNDQLDLDLQEEVDMHGNKVIK